MRDANAQTLRERKKTNPVHVGQLCVSRRPQVHFPALEGDVDTLRQRLHEVPLQPGLQPDQQGTSFCTFGYSDQTEKPVQLESSDKTEASSEQHFGN